MHQLAKTKTKQQQNLKQPTNPTTLPTPPHTTQRELELQCSRESSGEGLRSEESIGNRATRPQNQTIRQLVQGGISVLGRRSSPRQAGVQAGFHHPFPPECRAFQFLGASFRPSRPNPQRLAHGWGPTAGAVSPGRERRSTGGSASPEPSAEACRLPQRPPPGWGRGCGEAEGSRLLWI